MTTVATRTTERPLYGSGSVPRRTGVFGLSIWASAFAGVGFLTSLIIGAFTNVVYGFALAAVSAVLIAPLVIRWGHRSMYEVMQLKFQWYKRVATGSTVYRAGPHSRIPGGRYRLPGLFASTTLHMGTDRLGNPFGMIYRRRGAQYTVILECWPGGDEAHTTPEKDMMTADWGAYLAGLGLPGDIVVAVAIVESIPATGYRLALETEQAITHSRSEIASQIQREAAVEFPSGRSQTLCRLAITFRATTKDRRTEPEEMAAELARRLPTAYEDLLNAGVEASPMSAEQIVAFVHRSYNPSAERELEELDILDEPHGLGWEDAGPATALTKWDHYRHNGVVSVVYEMKAPPESVFTDEVLKPLLRPHDDLDRKRLAIVYRPFSAGDATKQVNREYKDARAAVNQKSGLVSAAAEMRVDTTEQARQEQVRGAGLVRYSALMTITCATPGEVPNASAILESLSARSMLKLVRAYGMQDAAFAAGLGAGVLLGDHTTTSKIARNG
ncbi:SCO6880 family protein [Rhodococcus erythropolis]|uniref:SCO6880 family protein n=1 Tax=Rhodococcus erythropolis TaxID=1833 RepID=UPI0022B30C62|nr:SCO6880 family protein [Rhodococcus erythropolis]MCZ4645120.1 hypothetical protein [Rhodococcus erythropolis]